VHFRSAGTYAIGQSKATAPAVRRNAPGQRRKVTAARRRRRWQHGNFCDRRGILNLEPRGVFCGAHTRGERIAGIQRDVGDAATLHAVLGSPGACRKRLALNETILVRVGIDQATDRTMLRGDFGLDAPPGVVIARDDDFPLTETPIRSSCS